MASLLALLVLTSSLDRGVLKPVLKAAAPQFKRCYERALRRDQPELGGKARLTLTVSPNGTVSEVAVEFPMSAPEFTRCLHDVALKLRFLKGPVEFGLIWPIVFKPG